jgi:hypothetical protein
MAEPEYIDLNDELLGTDDIIKAVKYIVDYHENILEAEKLQQFENLNNVGWPIALLMWSGYIRNTALTHEGKSALSDTLFEVRKEMMRDA